MNIIFLYYFGTVIVRFRAVGDAPLLKSPVFKVDGNKEFSTIINGLKVKLKHCTNLVRFIIR